MRHSGGNSRAVEDTLCSHEHPNGDVVPLCTFAASNMAAVFTIVLAIRDTAFTTVKQGLIVSFVSCRPSLRG